MSAFVAWFHRGRSLLLICCAVVVPSAGCHSTNNSSSPTGVVSKPKPGGFFDTEPKKVQTPSDFINLPRPQ